MNVYGFAESDIIYEGCNNWGFVSDADSAPIAPGHTLDDKLVLRTHITVSKVQEPFLVLACPLSACYTCTVWGMLCEQSDGRKAKD